MPDHAIPDDPMPAGRAPGPGYHPGPGHDPADAPWPPGDADLDAPVTLREYAGEIRELASRWLDGALSDPQVAAHGGNLVCSPAGLWLALAAVSCGALGDTAEELADLLGVAGPECAPLVTAVARDLARTDALAAATGVWSAAAVRDGFRSALPDIAFGALGDPAALDAWVDAATGGLVTRLPVDITPETRLVVANALALKARWGVPFDRDHTLDRTFTPAHGAAERVPTMFRKVTAADVWTIGAHGGPVHVVELVCAGERPALIRFALGPADAPPAPVMSAAWAPRSAGNPVPYDEVALRIPRFALRATLAVHAHLAALGITLATDPQAAEFGGLAAEHLYIDQAVQESVLRIDEEGVQAAAATAVRMSRLGRMPDSRPVLDLAFDRPFGCAVMDASGAVPLFAAYQAGIPDTATH